MSKRTRSIFSKPDEMEMLISYRAMRLTWIVVNAIFVGAAVVFLINDGLNPVSVLALIAAESIYFVIKGVLRWQMTRGGEDTE